MKHSEGTSAVIAALVAAQAEFKPAEFDKINPHFRSRYASLTSIITSVRSHLAKQDLAFAQYSEQEFIHTRLLHKSGEWMESTGTPIIVEKKTAQGYGSALTYARRYDLSSFLGIVADDDDDANEAEKMPPAKRPQRTRPTPPKPQPAPEPEPNGDMNKAAKLAKWIREQASLNPNASITAGQAGALVNILEGYFPDADDKKAQRLRLLSVIFDRDIGSSNDLTEPEKWAVWAKWLKIEPNPYTTEDGKEVQNYQPTFSQAGASVFALMEEADND